MNQEVKRRQPFATWEYFQTQNSILDDWRMEVEGYLTSSWMSKYDKPLEATDLRRTSYRLISGIYTSGQSIECVISRLEPLVAAYEAELEFAILAYGRDEVGSGFGENDDYEQFLQTLSLCILLGRDDLIPRLTAIFDRDNKGQDAIYESLLSFYANDRVKTDELFFKKPFAGLLKVIRAETPEQASKLLAKYCKDWYPAFKKAPWYDSHLSIVDDEGSYSGYWAFEAGAVAFLYGLDDSQIDHLVYPKDLVAYARERVKKTHSQPPVPAGQPCPKAGYWFSPAQQNSRRYFKQGELMPEFKGSSWGATIWYWSSES
jgi:Domain of unknown function (DUF1911)